jgi:CDP-glucose 4,6-dehydratase
MRKNMNLRETFNNKSVVVTGHTGFKGSWLSLWLISLGARVTGISINVPSEPSHFEALNLKDKMTDKRIDVANQFELNSAIGEAEPDFLFHLAAQPIVRQSFQDPIETWQTNLMGTVNVLNALRGLGKRCTAVFITSDKCYDNVEWSWGYRETDRLGGADPYSASKGAAELAIRSFTESFFPNDGPVRIGIGRAGNVIGGGDWAESRIVPDCVRAWSNNERVSIRNPHATRPWQHVLEPLSGYLTLARALNESSALHGEPFNFGPPANQNHSVGELVEAMSAHWQKVSWQDDSELENGPHECGLLKLNCDKALHFLNWQAVWDFSKTVSATSNWYKAFYEADSESIAELSLTQIKEYCANAKEQGQEWC